MKEHLVAVVAGQAHEDWRQGWFREKGPGAPRVKKTLDTYWSAQHGGALTVDIAATAYEDLPADWQSQNKLGATVAVDLVLEADNKGQALDLSFIETSSAVIHTKWVERNGSWCDPSLKVPYAELPESEKEKDRVFVTRAIAAYLNS